MWVIVELEWDYNNLDYLSVYGPYKSIVKATDAYDKLMENKKSYISYQIKEIQKLEFKA